MVSTAELRYRYIPASDGELDALLRGEDIGIGAAGDVLAPREVRPGETGVFVEQRAKSDRPVRPVALVVRDEDIRRLCGRYAQLRTDLSPLTAWCHLLTPRQLRSLDGPMHEPKLGGTEAAWTGLVVAEAMLLTRKPVANIRISACLASATYAVGRTKALWRDSPVDAIVQRFEMANRLCRGSGGPRTSAARTRRVRSAFVPMWHCLSALATNSAEVENKGELQALIGALKALQKARAGGRSDEAEFLVGPLLGAVPEAGRLGGLEEMAPESRLKLFDEIVGVFRTSDPKATARHGGLALLAGYLATVVAGGTASLSLVDDYAEEWPELAGWAYLVGSIGERVTWTSGFDGLGRLVARELGRRLRFDEAPTCDFALDEAIVLSDAQLKDPLVHLRIKQARVLSVALYPGVNIAVPVAEAAEGEVGEGLQPVVESPAERVSADTGRLLEGLAGALWPHIRPLVIREAARSSRTEGAGGKARGGRKTGARSGLPLRAAKK